MTELRELVRYILPACAFGRVHPLLEVSLQSSKIVTEHNDKMLPGYDVGWLMSSCQPSRRADSNVKTFLSRAVGGAGKDLQKKSEIIRMLRTPCRQIGDVRTVQVTKDSFHQIHYIASRRFQDAVEMFASA